MIATDKIDSVDASEATISALSEKVQAAEQALLDRLGEHADPPTPRTLQAEAQNGLSPSVMSIAFWRLVNSRAIELDSAGRVHGSAAAAGTTV